MQHHGLGISTLASEPGVSPSATDPVPPSRGRAILVVGSIR
jgi:hypothetical protein